MNMSDSRLEAQDTERELEEFRKQWHEEVQNMHKRTRLASASLPLNIHFSSPPSPPPSDPAVAFCHKSDCSAGTSKDNEQAQHEKAYSVALAASRETSQEVRQQMVEQDSQSAIELYRTAMDMERQGQLGQALVHYRRAFKVDPDIESKYRRLEQDQGHDDETTSLLVCGAHSKWDPLVAAATADGTDFRFVFGNEYFSHSTYSRAPEISSSNNNNHRDPLERLTLEFYQQDTDYIPAIDYKPVHVAKLPGEILVDILRHLVLCSTSSIASFALVCKRFFLATRSPSLWRYACEHAFRAPGMTLQDSRRCQAEIIQALYGGYWLRMYIERPRIRYDGVYISVCQYIRPGTSDTAWTQPVHLVTYYRYLRFFPNGSVLKYLSTDEPASVVKLLTPQFSRRQVFRGYFTIEESKIAIEMRDKARPHDKFEMHLYIKSTSRGRHNKLGWERYSSRKDGREESTNYDLRLMRPYFFSPVRSYVV